MPRTTTDTVPRGRLSGLGQPVLESGTCTLRPWRASDQASVVAAFDDPDIRRWHARSMTAEEAAAWIAHWPDRWRAETGAGWALAVNDEPVGQISLRHLNHADGVSDVSYWVMPAFRGRGVASAALGTLAVWAFDVLGLHRIFVDHSTRNPASCAVATRAGFRLEGTKREDALHADGWHDMHLHARLAADVAPAG
ncbi:GNAT family N-acetyltransferase [Cellulomonas cellasea]|uniref:GNAT family N-acetyltransferase n=1 Tax=Cellulomonas cellasea TaxID=43670 RepID=UPI0025A37508|nr:GNAT family N-acetyltransferase [Cellulomonas cellasea]MDM8085316.1 GNAT family N-acetyltransferase [Cellulomonas cellasea]